MKGLLHDLQDHDLDERLLARPQGRTSTDRKAHGFSYRVLADPRTVGALRGIRRIGDEVVAILLDRHAEGPDERSPGKPAVLPDGDGDGDQPAIADPPAFIDGCAVSGENHVSIEDQAADADLVDLLRLSRSKADYVSILLNDRVRNAVA